MGTGGHVSRAFLSHPRGLVGGPALDTLAPEQAGGLGACISLKLAALLRW